MKSPISLKNLPASCLIVFTLQFIFLSSLSAEKAPDFRLSNLEAERFTSEEFKGKMIISFFYTACIPCRQEIPALYKFVSEKYPATALLFIDPLESEDASQIRRFVQNKLKLPLKYFYHDALGRLASKFDVSGIFPTIVGVENNQIKLRIRGSEENFLQKIDSFLGQ